MSQNLPSLDSTTQTMEHIIRYSLDKYQFRSAVFLAERLLSQLRGSGSAEQREYGQYLLATSHYRQGKPEAAWAVLEGCNSPRCRFLFAQCCLDLRRYIECNGVLECLLEDSSLPSCVVTDPAKSYSTSSVGNPDRSSVLNLMGQSARAQQRLKLAIKYFNEALELNPFLWEAFENLCELGFPMDPNNMFSQLDARIFGSSLESLGRISRTMGMRPSVFSTTNDSDILTHAKSMFSNNIWKRSSSDLGVSSSTYAPLVSSGRQPVLGQAGDSSSAGLAESSHSAASTDHERLANPPPEDDRVALRRGTSTSARRILKVGTTGVSGGITKRATPKITPVATLAASALTKGKSQSKAGAKRDLVNSEERDQGQQALTTISTSTMDPDEEEGLRAIADVFKIMARAYGLLALNKFAEALTEFERLPFNHLESGWVQCQLAKCKFEMLDYVSAARFFEHARELEPNLQRDMEIYSTCLWQLRKEMTLSTLAKELKDTNHLSPQAWVALGNAYSMKHESAQALKCFKRATQLNDRFAYAHTLSGLEYTELEEYDKAQMEFRTAMSIDPRHYHAWYGMGMTYNKMGKNDLALIHIKEAHRLNPSNSVLLYIVGTIQEKMSRTTEALRSFEQAIELNPSNVTARFRKAHVQLDMEQYEEALKELEAIAKLSPDEANVFTLQGRVLLKMGQKEEALKYFTWALNLDSKSSHTIRDLIEKMSHDPSNERGSYEVQVDRNYR
ncbi:anaphase-promoting complex subunit cdc27 [Mortierella sp. GBA43]|nr:anaphase-promoting complex subunit cdc27 [Mortierella sp. GBA43]